MVALLIYKFGEVNVEENMRKNEKTEDTFRELKPCSDSATRNAHIVVIGGGVAGVSAAIELAERGMRVTLLEAADTLGGKVKGWRDAEGYSIEHGLHGWWMDYTNFRDLIARVGITSNLTEPIGPFTVIHRDGIVDRLTFSRLPSPFHITE